MGFSPEVRNRALVAAARYCCVCHKRGGVNVEVHHIIPEADSHDNSFENAIPLCFDCHAAAGHFNPRHPRGTKFSPEELRRHRDNWYKIVEENKVPSSDVRDYLRIRYHIVKNYEIVRGIQNGNLPNVWGMNRLYFPGEIGNLHAEYIGIHGKEYRRCDIFRRAFRNEQEYISNGGGRTLLPDERTWFPAYSVTRALDTEDRELLSREDVLLGKLLDQGVPIETLALPLGYDCGCSGAFLDEIISRPFWPVLIELANYSKDNLVIEKIVSEYCRSSKFSVIPLNERERIPGEIPISRMPIKPGESIFVPIMTLLGPFTGDLGNAVCTTQVEHSLGVIDTVDNYIGLDKPLSLLLLGPSHWPKELQGSANGTPFFQEIHPCDFEKFFTIDRDYMCGSCPHLFKKDVSGKITYVRELLKNGRYVEVTDAYTNEDKDVEIQIVELEDEITTITRLCIDDLEALSGKTLKKGDYISLYLRAGENMRIYGMYEPYIEVAEALKSSLARNRMILKWLRKT